MTQQKIYHDAIRILRISDVTNVLGRSRSAIYSMLNMSSTSYDPSFPRPIRLSTRTIGWRYADISAWIDSRPRCNAKNREAA